MPKWGEKITKSIHERHAINPANMYIMYFVVFIRSPIVFKPLQRVVCDFFNPHIAVSFLLGNDLWKIRFIFLRAYVYV